jgi:ubiquinone biosynthesis protein COQ9
MSDKLESARAAILAAALPAVPFDGWSWQCLRAACDAAGFDHAMARRAFPGGPGELLSYYQGTLDQRVEAALAGDDLLEMKIRERVSLIIRTRLAMMAPDREAVRQSLSAQVRPDIARHAVSGLYRTVDRMWWLAGDTATDFNHYTKRAMLTGVYTSTVLVWLNDDSEGFEQTWAFLDRRIADVMTVEKVRGRIENGLSRLPSPWTVLRRLRYGRAA